MSRNARWAIWMTIGGLVTAAVVWALTDSLQWGLVGLLGSSVIFNLLWPATRPH
jgi:hypothetical protein